MDFSSIWQKIKELLGKISNYAKKRVALRKMKKNLPPPTQKPSKKQTKEEFEDDEDLGDEDYPEELDDENDDYSQMEGEDEA